MTPLEQRLNGPSPATAIALDMVKRGLPFLPVGILIGALFDGTAGAISVVYGMALVLANFVAAAYLLAWAARISFALVGAVALGGYALRLGLIFCAVWVVRDVSWMRPVPLGITIVVTHLGLLVWELRFVSASLAHPGLKPRSGSSKPAAGYR